MAAVDALSIEALSVDPRVAAFLDGFTEPTWPEALSLALRLGVRVLDTHYNMDSMNMRKLRSIVKYNRQAGVVSEWNVMPQRIPKTGSMDTRKKSPEQCSQVPSESLFSGAFDPAPPKSDRRGPASGKPYAARRSWDPSWRGVASKPSSAWRQSAPPQPSAAPPTASADAGADPVYPDWWFGMEAQPAPKPAQPGPFQVDLGNLKPLFDGMGGRGAAESKRKSAGGRKKVSSSKKRSGGIRPSRPAVGDAFRLSRRRRAKAAAVRATGAAAYKKPKKSKSAIRGLSNVESKIKEFARADRKRFRARVAAQTATAGAGPGQDRGGLSTAEAEAVEEAIRANEMREKRLRAARAAVIDIDTQTFRPKPSSAGPAAAEPARKPAVVADSKATGEAKAGGRSTVDIASAFADGPLMDAFGKSSPEVGAADSQRKQDIRDEILGLEQMIRQLGSQADAMPVPSDGVSGDGASGAAFDLNLA